jgi:molybdopterin synthase catalytic subunit
MIAAVRSPAAGAVVLFLGTVREMTNGRRTVALEYECYAEMAEKKLAELEAEARGRWPLSGCAIAHRWGRLEIGEISVAIAVAAPHRREAFAAGQWLIDRAKEVVPIWKKELYADGAEEWQHPHDES